MGRDVEAGSYSPLQESSIHEPGSELGTRGAMSRLCPGDSFVGPAAALCPPVAWFQHPST